MIGFAIIKQNGWTLVYSLGGLCLPHLYLPPIFVFYSKVSRDTLYEAVKEVLQGSVAKPRK